MENIEKPKTSARDFFLHLSVIVALYVSAVSLINLLFETINRAFPDPLEYYTDPYSGTIRFAIASLIIIFPIFLYFTLLQNRDYVLSPAKRELGIRKWLTFLTLFLAGIAIVVDLITLINTFLGGEITTRFELKVLAVFVISGLIFGYYLSDLRDKVSKTGHRIWAIGAGALIIVAIIVGFVIMGSPSTARAQRFDDRRIQDLQSIQWQVVNFWQNKQKLPATLSEINDPISGFIVPNDPETGNVYTYRVVSEAGIKPSFNLCAVFGLSSNGNLISAGKTASIKQPFPVGAIYENWQHGVGEVCFDRSIDPELYKKK